MSSIVSQVKEEIGSYMEMDVVYDFEVNGTEFQAKIAWDDIGTNDGYLGQFMPWNKVKNRDHIHFGIEDKFNLAICGDRHDFPEWSLEGAEGAGGIKAIHEAGLKYAAVAARFDDEFIEAIEALNDGDLRHTPRWVVVYHRNNGVMVLSRLEITRARTRFDDNGLYMGRSSQVITVEEYLDDDRGDCYLSYLPEKNLTGETCVDVETIESATGVIWIFPVNDEEPEPELDDLEGIVNLVERVCQEYEDGHNAQGYKILRRVDGRLPRDFYGSRTKNWVYVSGNHRWSDTEDYGDEVFDWVQQDFNRLVDLYDGLWGYLGVMVRLNAHGEAWESVWGVESDGDYHLEVIAELVSQLLSSPEFVAMNEENESPLQMRLGRVEE